jgi:hypothetical protein
VGQLATPAYKSKAPWPDLEGPLAQSLATFMAIHHGLAKRGTSCRTVYPDRVTLQFDDHTPYVIWFDETVRQAPATFDRFGLFNIARFGTQVEICLGDLTVNDEKIGKTPPGVIFPFSPCFCWRLEYNNCRCKIGISITTVFGLGNQRGNPTCLA